MESTSIHPSQKPFQFQCRKKDAVGGVCPGCQIEIKKIVVGRCPNAENQKDVALYLEFRPGEKGKAV